MSSILDVDAVLAGQVAVHSCLLRRLEGHCVVVRADIETVIKEGKVTLISGGGSGHEPAHTGYVGRGMLSAAVTGAVFAPPPPESILAALRAVKSPRGTLMIVKNYANDVHNFTKALEQAVSEGMDVKMVIVGEDCVLPSTGKADKRRGLCGTILVHKIAGALAERGDSLEEVTSAAEKVANSMVTMGARRSPNSGHFIIGEGIHEEAGKEICPEDTVVERMLTLMTSQEPGYQHLKIVPGIKVVLVVNNLGGAANRELPIVANAAIKHLEEKTQVKVTGKCMANLMTSLKIDGFSLTLLKASLFWEECLDLHTTAPGWPNVSFGQPEVTGDSTTSTAIMSDEESQAIVDKALKSGSLKQRNTVAVVVGIAGAGKTWLIHRLFKIDPPPTYTSTGIAEQSFRGLTSRTADICSWQLLQQNDILKFIAPFIHAGLPETDIPSLVKNYLEKEAPELTQVPSGELSLSPALPTSHSIATAHPEQEKSDASKTMTSYLKFNVKRTDTIELLHMIDTGGQPEFMEIMPSLIHNSNLTLLVLNLNQSLDEEVKFAFYENDKSFKRLNSIRINRQIIHQLARTLQAKWHTQHSKVSVIGTHRDCVEKKGKLQETLEAMNEEVESLFMEDELIVPQHGNIFSVNLLEPDYKDEEVLENVRNFISEAVIGVKAEIPFSFFMFEHEAIKCVEQKLDRKVRILSFEECVQVGAKLEMSRKVVQAALIFFHRHNIFLYFQHILPNVVFLAPQVPLDFVNAIVAFKYKVTNAGAMPKQYKRFCREGIITEEMLHAKSLQLSGKDLQLSDCFIPGIYEPQDAIKLFLHIYAIAPLNNEEPLAKNQQPPTLLSAPGQKLSEKRQYLMMTLLNDMPEEDIKEYLPSSSKVAPLVIHFGNGCVPNGCFCNTISFLISTYNWKVCRIKAVPECLAHNIVTLSDPTLPVTITMVNYTRHLEIHVSVDDIEEKDLSNICLKIRETVLASIAKVFRVMKFEDMQVEPRLLCPCECTPSHAATVCTSPNSSSIYIHCSERKKPFGCLQKEQQFWLQDGKIANPPRITTHPEAINTIPGKHVTFIIQATGTEPLNYKWECKIGDGSDVERIPGANSSTLAIPSVQKSNEGSYCCTVSNCAGSETSEYATLTVADPPRITTHPCEIKDAVPGNLVTFTIQATGTEPLNYQWEHKTGDGNEVERNPGANSSTLTIPKVKKSDEGSYHCTVSNCAGSETSRCATLTVDGGWWRLLKTIVGILIVGILIIALLALVFLWVSRNGDHPHDTTQPTLPYSSKPPRLTSNTVVCHSISETQELEKAVAEIGDWESLCENLEVPNPVMMRLRFSNKQDGRKKRECLQAYIDLGEACWEEVVKVVANDPFYNKRLAYEIASKYKDEL